MPKDFKDSSSDERKSDPSRERSTVTERGGSPFPDPRAPKPATEVKVVPGQPYPSPGNPGGEIDVGGGYPSDQHTKAGGR